MKKFISLLLALTVILALAACGKETTPNEEDTTVAPVSEENTEAIDFTNISEDVTAEVDKSDTAANTDTVADTDSSETTVVKDLPDYLGDMVFLNVRRFDFSKVDPDPSKWTKEEIVACYKSGMAMEDHADVQTDQKFELIGDLPGKASILEKPIKLAMKLAAKPYGTLCGGYWDLEASDLKGAEARKEGDYVIINLYPKDQVDGPNGDEHSGTVGHVVNVVSGIDSFISYVEENFSVLNAQYDDDSVVLKYTNAYAKDIKINTKTGKMESGTWGYTLDVYLDHCSMAGVDFENFHTTIGWTCWYPVTD